MFPRETHLGIRVWLLPAAWPGQVRRESRGCREAASAVQLSGRSKWERLAKAKLSKVVKLREYELNQWSIKSQEKQEREGGR